MVTKVTVKVRTLHWLRVSCPDAVPTSELRRGRRKLSACRSSGAWEGDGGDTVQSQTSLPRVLLLLVCLTGKSNNLPVSHLYSLDPWSPRYFQSKSLPMLKIQNSTSEVARGGLIHSAAPPSKPTAEAQRNPSHFPWQFENHPSKSWRMNY